MSTDFKTNNTQVPGSFIPKATNTPLDIRTVVETEADILSIPVPYIGMIVYVKDTGKRFEILTLKDKKSGMSIIKSGAVDTYRELIGNFIIVDTVEQRDDYLQRGLIYPGMAVYVLNTQKEYRYIDDTWKEIQNDLANYHEHENKDVLDNITIQDIANWNAKSDFSGSYLDLSDLPKIPSKVSDLSNDLSFATESFVTNKIAEAKLEQSEIDLSGFATKDDIKNINLDLAANYATLTYVDEQISTHEHNVISDDEIIQEINKD